MISDSRAVQFAANAISDVFHDEATDGEIAVLFACALHESGFGYNWRGAGVGSFNMGAVQCGKWTGKRFVYVDTHPNADGTSTRYTACFRAYDSEQLGWDDLCRIMYQGPRKIVREAAIRNDWHGVSKSMHSTVYYEGFGKTVEDRIRNHQRAMSRGINRALAVLGAQQVITPALVTIQDLPTLSRGSTSEAVKLLQRELQLAADGIFGPVTQAAVRTYQTLHGLVVDGRVGPATWKALLTDEYVPS